jgi:hypothetical protein
LLYGKDTEPLLHVPLKASATGQDLPVDLTAERKDQEGLLTLTFVGRYEAVITVRPAKQ